MKQERNQNSFLISCVCSIVLLLTLCYFGVNTNLKGTAAANTSNCPSGYTDWVVEYNGVTYCGNSRLKYDEDGKLECSYLEYDENNVTGTGYICSGPTLDEDGVITYECKTSDLSYCSVAASTSVEIPTAASHCQSGLVYNGNSQTLTKTEGTGYTFSNNTRTDVGSQDVIATLKNGYVWSDGTAGTQKFSCSIAKATPTITVSPTSLSVEEGSTGTFTIKSSVVGDFTITSSATSKATVNKPSYSDITANTSQTVTVTGVSSGSSTITVAFTPNDTKNYNNASSKTVSVTVTESDEKVDIPTAASHCQSGLVYNGNSQTLTKTAGEGYTFSNNTRTNAGIQEVTATLKSGYVWKGGSTGTQKFSCSIAKAQPVLTVSKYKVTLTNVTTTTLEYEYNGDGNLSCSSDSVATCKIENGKLLVVPKSVGSTEITLTATEGTNYTAASQKVSVTVTEHTSGEETPTEETFTATFDANGGRLSGNGSKSCKTTSNECEITDLPTATRDGYTFKGWGTGKTCTDGEAYKLTLDANTTYYACWSKNEVTNTPDVDEDGNVEDNVQTGDIAIAFIWFFGLLAIGYASYYFKSIKEN